MDQVGITYAPRGGLNPPSALHHAYDPCTLEQRAYPSVLGVASKLARSGAAPLERLSPRGLRPASMQVLDVAEILGGRFWTITTQAGPLHRSGLRSSIQKCHPLERVG